MHLIKSSKVKLLICSLISINLFASNEAFDEKIISDKRLENFNLTKEELAVMGQKSRTLAIGQYSESKILEKFESVFTGM